MNKFSWSVANKVGFTIILSASLILIINGLYSFYFNRGTIIEDNKKELKTVIDYHEKRLNDAIREMDQDLKLVQENDLVKNFAKAFDSRELDSTERQNYRNLLNKRIFSKIEEFHDYEDIIITDVPGKIMFQQSDLTLENKFFKKHLNRRIAEFYSDRLIIEGSTAYTYASRPLYNNDGELLGVIICKVHLMKLLREISYLSPSAENVVLSYGIKNQNQVMMISMQADRIVKAPKKGIFNEQSPLFLACMQNEGEGFFKDHLSKDILTVYRPLKPFNIGIMAQIPKSNIFIGLDEHFNNLILEGFALFMLVAIGLGWILIIKLNNGLKPIQKALIELKEGSFPKPLFVETGDEFEEIATIVNAHVQRLKESAEFADQIGDGNLQSDNYHAIGSHDTLGLKLIKMKENLKEQDEKDSNNSWVVTGFAELSDVLREFQTIDQLSIGVVKYLYKRIGATNGKIFLTNEKNEQLEMISSFAFEKQKYLKKSISIGSKNILTDAFMEQKSIYRTEIPNDYYYIPSGKKEDKGPKSILVVPLITAGTIYGVLDFCSDLKLTQTKIKFIEEVSDIIARTVFNIRVNEQTRDLLEQSQEMSNELQKRQNILQENAVEMEKKSQEVEFANKRLEQQINEVKNAQSRTHILLKNASEVITIYNSERKITYISPSVESILGYHPDDLIGTNDAKFLDKEHRDTLSNMFQELLRNKSVEIVQFPFKKADGTEIWLEAVGNNMIDNPAIHGIVINYQDITQRRRAQEEQRKRGQMQALSENSLDLITRIDADGSFFYINPTIESLTGQVPDQYLNRKLTEVGLNVEVASIWSKILEEVIHSKKKTSHEMNFPTLNEDKIMRINAIPEFDAKETNVESVLMVAHDITESKKRENEIKAKNKKIQDSINYAQRIQHTILPNNELLKSYLPQSFMIFRPRDLVSGDFPWIFTINDHVIIAAVDCTGHGVPGAMISLVGYFLLNEVVVGNRIYQPGQILNELDKLVTNTFRQNSESATIKDGMDVAICSFNSKTGHLDYAGAHRPLYIVRKEEEELQQVKGNKFPIGGGSAFKTKTTFTNFEEKLNKGDAFYFFSDGLPDQFGGPQDRKLGSKRIRNFLQETKGQGINTIENSMTKFLDNWQGKERQFDDILIFGVEY